ncbi:DUF4254 domain-containing protein [Geomonas terrae]|uniref:DUF4254 domain-containing protein n=1 Tax=Geomonas terrae TaxID=2562681 RepID=A0A4S1CMG5_9BACT|nr:DUF4254 domain-containing protein [Geomonas terrae]TGU74974.1 DUF4254 domain-containing protein [Geomonas terrae]
MLEQQKKHIVIGDNSPGVGDYLLLTAVAREVKLANPFATVELQVSKRAELFLHNPFIDEVRTMADPFVTPNSGDGLWVERKCRFYGVEPHSTLPQIFLTDHEVRQAAARHKRTSKPLITIGIDCAPHWKHVRYMEGGFWQAVLKELGNDFDLVQIGLSGNITPLPGVPQLLDLPLREAAALQHLADLHLGVDTGDMHLALACGTDAIALVPQSSPDYNWKEWHYPSGVDYLPFGVSPSDVAGLIRTRVGTAPRMESLTIKRGGSGVTTARMASAKQIAQLVLARIAMKHDDDAIWSDTEKLLPFEANLVQLLDKNYEIWHLEDEARRADVSDSYIAGLKRQIDKSNQARNDIIERVDESLLHLVTNPSAPLNTEPPGLSFDRLTVLCLKIFHMEQEVQRDSASKAHRETCALKMRRLSEQLDDLTRALSNMLLEFRDGTRAFKTYYQFKMYNDASLNPSLYGSAPGAGAEPRFTPRQQYLFDKVTSLPGDAVIVEIGADHAEMATALGSACRGSARKVHCLATGRDFEAELTAAGLADQVTVLKSDSDDPLSDWSGANGGAQIDFLLIALHPEKGFPSFLSGHHMVKDGGLIGFYRPDPSASELFEAMKDLAQSALVNHEETDDLLVGQKMGQTTRMLEILISKQTALHKFERGGRDAR